MDFIGRTEELNFFEKQYHMEHSFVSLTGRRHVGKSRLIEEFIKGKTAWYYEVNQEPPSAIMESFSKVVSDYTGKSFGVFDEWDEAFETLVENLPEGKNIVVLDEFQNLMKAFPGFDIEFKTIWDRYLSKQNIMVIICSSVIPAMRRMVSEYGSPLYGRVTGNLILKPLRFDETTTYNNYRKDLEKYSVTGGVPRYIKLYDDSRSPLENIFRLTMNAGSPLLSEPEFLLSNEFKEISSYNTYMKIIADGHRKMEEICSMMEKPPSYVCPYLNTLIDAGIVEQHVSVLEKNPDNCRESLYLISDYFIRLWFRFIYQHRSRITRNESDEAYSELKNHFIDSHVSFVFEDDSRQCLKKHLRSKDIAASYGSHWEGCEIDVLAISRNMKTAYVGECKYRDRPIPQDVLHGLEKKIPLLPLPKGYRAVLCLFSVSGYTEELIEEAHKKGVILFNEGNCIFDPMGEQA